MWVLELVAKWRQEGNAYDRDGVLVRGEALLRRVADELEAAARAHEDELLTVAQAAEETGLSEETLRRQVREGTLPAVRNDVLRSHIKLHRGDLPQKHRPRVENRRASEYDPEEDARDIAQLLEQKS